MSYFPPNCFRRNPNHSILTATNFAIDRWSFTLMWSGARLGELQKAVKRVPSHGCSWQGSQGLYMPAKLNCHPVLDWSPSKQVQLKEPQPLVSTQHSETWKWSHQLPKEDIFPFSRDWSWRFCVRITKVDTHPFCLHAARASRWAGQWLSCFSEPHTKLFLTPWDYWGLCWVEKFPLCMETSWNLLWMTCCSQPPAMLLLSTPIAFSKEGRASWHCQ